MRKHKKRQIEHVKWRMQNPNTPLWIKSLDPAFRKIWRDASKKWEENDKFFMNHPMYMVCDEAAIRPDSLIRYGHTPPLISPFYPIRVDPA